MKVIRAEAMGLCFGVRDALEMAEHVSDPHDVTIHGELVHNRDVLVQLETRGFGMTAEDDRTQLPDTSKVLVTAHGISRRERRRLRAAGKQLIDTTCPLVMRLHRVALALDAEGRHVIVIGRADHVEVRGVVEDLRSYDVVAHPHEVIRYPHRRLGIVCQTTTPPRTAQQVRKAIRKRNRHAEIRFFDTICQPTRDRQSAVERLVRQVDVMVVVGGGNSNNTRQLASLCRARGVKSFHIQSAADIDSDWFSVCAVVGLTAGTSTPTSTIEDVYQTLCQLPVGTISCCHSKQNEPIAR